MKKSRALIALVLVFTLILSTGSVFAASTGYSDLSGGYYGYYFDETTDTSVSDGVLTVTQNADQLYNYPDTEANIFSNSSFENSTDVVSAARLDEWTEINSGWALSNEVRNTRLNITIVDDAHSGNNAFRIERILNDTNTSDISVSFYNLDTVKNTLDASDTDKTIRDGAITGLESGKDYIFSYWVKGNAETRFQYREDVANGSAFTYATAENYKDSAKQDQWELVSMKLTADSVGVWANIYCLMTNVAGTYAVIDDVQFMKLSDAEAMVKQMIADLDITSPTAARAIDDIEQWCAKLSLTDTDEYATFESKKDAYSEHINSVYEVNYTNNMYKNSGFEVSDTEVTDWIIPTTNDTVSIVTNDTHSGKNALKYTATASTANESVVYNVTSSAQQVEDDTYILSAWVKGNSPRFFYRPTVKESSYDSTTETVTVTLSGTTRYGNYDNFYSDWTLLTYSFSPVEVTVTTDDAGTELTTYWMVPAVTINPPDTEGAYTLIDDAALMKKSDAIANVENMIDELDVNSVNSARAIADIEQWVTALGSANISNYDLFTQKLLGGYIYYNNANFVKNSGFELSTSESATAGWGLSSENYTATISNDSHTGNNAVSFTGTTGENRVYYNSSNVTYVPSDDEYIASMWTKGGTAARLMYWTYDSTEETWSGAARAGTQDEKTDWTLVAQKLTPGIDSEKHAIKWGISVNAKNTTDNVMIDDVMVIKVTEAIAMVADMIDNLDATSDYYARANEDIKQWVAALDDTELTAAYNAKLAECNAVLEDMTNIITPNTGFGVGEYMASVSLKGEGKVGLFFHQKGNEVTLTDEWATYTEFISVADGENAMFGVQLFDTADVTTTYIKDFALVKLENGDANFDKKVDIRDLVRLRAHLGGENVEISTGVADANGDGELTSGDIEAIRNIILEIAG